MSGLSVAHELAERGYAVTVYEYDTALGGKARSMDVPGTGSGGRKPLPGEHGFRFFPGFYRNLPDTLRRIPFPGNAHGVHDNLRDGTEALIARNGGRPDLRVPFRTATAPPNPTELTPETLRETITAVLDTGFRLPAHEAAYFANRLPAQEGRLARPRRASCCQHCARRDPRLDLPGRADRERFRERRLSRSWFASVSAARWR